MNNQVISTDDVKETLQGIENSLNSVIWNRNIIGNFEEFIGESPSWKFVIIKVHLDGKDYTDGSAISKVAESKFNIVHLTQPLVKMGLKLALRNIKK